MSANELLIGIIIENKMINSEVSDRVKLSLVINFKCILKTPYCYVLKLWQIKRIEFDTRVAKVSIKVAVLYF